MERVVMIDRTISIAPMLDWTDRFDRYFLRLITRHALLYTEMIHVNAVLRGDAQRFLQFDPAEHPLALQVGGSNSKDLTQCARIAEDQGYDEININVGCPSERVQAGSFGACLMAEPELIAECVANMQAKVTIPVSVKSRIGINDNDHYDYLYRFIDTVAQTGCKIFIIHARTAWLKGLSPKENRDIPPLKYDHVYQLKRDFPALSITINGGIKSLDAASEHLQFVDGVMIGRQAYHDPYSLVEVDRRFYHDEHLLLSRTDIVEHYLPYVAAQLQEGIRLQQLTRHILGLFQGQPGGRHWRRYLTQHATVSGAGIEVIEQALQYI